MSESTGSIVLHIHLAKNMRAVSGRGIVSMTTMYVQVEIDLSELQVGQRYKTWYRLQHHEPKQKEKK